MSLRRLSALLCLALLAALPAAAQEQSGAIEGTIRDSGGAAVPGATVQAKSTNGVTLTTTSSSLGSYRFPSLAPGRYEITATMAGFSPAKVPDMSLALGQVLTANLTLSVGGVAETIQVTAEAPLIDVKQSARMANIRDELINRLPKGRDFTSLATQAPGANIESKLGGLSIDGSSPAENLYVVDGIETTNLQTGVSGKNVITDFVEEVQVKSSGYPAEYRGATGGVVNVITRSGTNAWKGEVGAYYLGDGLEGDRRQTLRRVLTDVTKAEYVTYAKDSFSRIEPGFSLGGPLARDKMWFFASYQPALTSTDRTVTFRSNNQTGTYNENVKVHYATANLSAQLGANTRARVAFNSSPSSTDGLLPNEDGSSNPATNYDVLTNRPNYSVSGNVDYTANPSLFFSFRGGYFWRDMNQEGIFQGPRYVFNGSNINMAGVPSSLQQVSGYSNTLGNSETTRDQQTRLSFQSDASFFASAGGQHAFKAGLQLDRVGNDAEVGETGNLVTLFWNQALSGNRGPFGYYTVRSNGVAPKRGFLTQGNIHSNNVGLFVQDSWTIHDRFTLNLGLRTENEHIPSFADPSLNLPESAINFSFGDKLAPRVGFAWDVKGDARWKAYASWGIFYDITKLEMPRGSFGGDKWLQYYYTMDTPNWPTLVDGSGCPPACPGTLFSGPIDFRHPSNSPDANTIDPDIKPYKLQEAVIGIEHELTKVVSLSVRYVHKQLDVAIEDVGSLDAQQNEIYTIGNPGFGQAAQTGFGPAFPKAKRDYDAVEAAFTKRMSSRWFMRASYLWSSLNGNFSGLTQSDEAPASGTGNGRTSPNVGRTFDYPIMAFGQNGQPVYGALATDRTHQFKLQGNYEFKFGTNIGLQVYAASGIPISREARFIPPNNYPVQYLGRNSDGRTPMYSQTDLYLEHQFKVGGAKRLALSVNVLNLLDQDTVVNKFPTETQAGQGLRITEQQFFAGFDAQSLFTAQNVPRDPRFLMANAFQDPRSMRLSVRFIF